MASPIIGFTEMQVNQASKYLTFNEALRLFEGIAFRVISRTIAAQPVTPSDGDSYILPASPTGTDWGSWSEHDVVLRRGSEWVRVVPFEGLGPLWVNADDERVSHDGTTWVVDGGGWINDSGDIIARIAGNDVVTISGTQLLMDGGTVSAPMVADVSDTNTGPYHPSADNYAISTGGTQALNIDASQNIDVPNGGITLNGGTDLLNEYDEGTWTPVIADASSAGNSASHTTTLANYTRVGRVVTVSFRLIDIDTTGCTAGNNIFIRIMG